MFTIALIEPQIPQNTGNIARLCAATNTKLEIVGNLGFELDDKHLKRAGLDYWQYAKWSYTPNLEEYMDKLNPINIHLLTTKTKTPYTSHKFKKGDILLFGSETTGISENYRNKFTKSCCTIPMSNSNIRSLNLSTAAGIVLYEALRQQK